MDDTRYQIGQVIFDKVTREIRFPGKVNMNEKLVEYVIVLQKGKIHESLIITDVSPTDINLAFTLLRYKPSIELFSLIEETGHPTGIYPHVPAAIKAAARIAISLEWNEKGTTHRIALHECLQADRRGKGMPAGPWLYTGSDLYNGVYIPELSGALTSIIVDQSSMINYPGSLDESMPVWYPIPEKLPPVGASLTVIITPWLK
jgi:hypothetical protein